MDLGLKGLNALVTGGSKGIGRRVADTFADEGANVAICARQAGDVESAVAALKAKGVTAYGAKVDVADKAGLETFVADGAKALGGLDILVANVSALAVEDNEEAWRRAFETDMLHTVRAANAALPYLEKSKHPAIVIISSVSGREVDFTGPAYGAFKAALIHYAQRLAFQLAPKMIRVNAVSARQHLFRRRRLAEHRARPAGPVRAGAGAQSDRAYGGPGGDRARRGVPGEPRLQLHDGNQSGDRRGADARRSVVTAARA